MIARSSNDGLKHEAVHLIDRSLVTLIPIDSASVQSLHAYIYTEAHIAMHGSWLEADSQTHAFYPSD